MEKITINEIDNIDSYAEVTNFNPEKNKLIVSNDSNIDNIIINFPFRQMYYLGNNINILYKNKQNLTIKSIIDNLLTIILKYESKNFTFIEGVKVRFNGCYNLSCIHFDKLKYNYTNLYKYEFENNKNIYYINLNFSY
tara:strand:+ start:9251 stop:9664 length:414 start_codon:yes stop_codon:yes gene_type:complete